MNKLLLLVPILIACGSGAGSQPTTANAATTHRSPTAAGFRPSLEGLLDELKSTPNVTIDDTTFGTPAPKGDLDDVKARLYVSDKLLALWTEMNGAKITWKGPQRTAGGVEIPAVADAFKDGKGRTYTDDDPPDSPKRKFYVIDASDPGSGGNATGIVLDGTDDPAVFYLEDGNELKPLGVKLDGYFRLLEKARAFNYWQEAVVVDVSGEDESTIEPREFRILMPKVFQHYAPSDVLHRDYTAKDQATIKAAADTIAKIQSELKKQNAKATVRDREAVLGVIEFEIPKDPANVKAVERAFTAALGSQWKGQLTGAKSGASMSIGEVHVDLR